MIKIKTRRTPNAGDNQRNCIPHTCWWECEKFRKSDGQFLIKLNMKLLYCPVIAILVIYPPKMNTYVHTKICTQRFRALLLVIIENKNNPDILQMVVG